MIEALRGVAVERGIRASKDEWDFQHLNAQVADKADVPALAARLRADAEERAAVAELAMREMHRNHK